MAKRKKRSPRQFKSNFIRQRIPSFKIPPYRGKHYDAFVPDTLDIQDRIRLAVNGLTGPTDPDKDYLMYFRANFRSNPPSMTHDESDSCLSKFMEALPLLRIACGSSLNQQVDPAWMATGLRTIGPEGVPYWPSLPWAPLPSTYLGESYGTFSSRDKHYCEPWYAGRLMSALTVYLTRDPSGPWEKEIRRIVDGLWTLAIERDDFAYFRQGPFVPNKRRDPKAPMPQGSESSHAGWTLHGLAQFHRATGYEPAVRLAEKLSRYLRYHGKYYGPNGEFLPGWPGYGHKDEGWSRDEQGFDPGPPPINNLMHFQHHMIPLLGMLDHALAVGDADLADFVRQSFEYGRARGDLLMGYFPENVDNPTELETSEMCEVANMIALALKLTAANVGDYWDDADRWIRNHFTEGQLTRPEWVYHLAEGGLVTGKTRIPPSQYDPVSESCDRVPERNLGAYAGWPSANDWFIGQGSGIMHCCTGNAARALYYIWEHMLHYDRGNLSINLLLNRPSKWADVSSHVPYAGQVDISVKRRIKQLRIRIPEWVTRRQVKCTINGRKCSPDWDRRYALLGPVGAKDEVTMAFPIAERHVQTDIQSQHYHLITRGNEIVDIYPRGEFCPLYQRDFYRTDQTRWKKTERFVSDENLFW